MNESKGILSLLFGLVIIVVRDGPTVDPSLAAQIKACIEGYVQVHIRLLDLPHDTTVLFSIGSADYTISAEELDRINDSLTAVGTQIRASTFCNSSVILTTTGGFPLLSQSIAVAASPSAATPGFLVNDVDLWSQP